MIGGKLAVTCCVVCLGTIMACADLSLAAPLAVKEKTMWTHPDNAGNRSLPLSTLESMMGQRKYAEVRATVARIKPTAANANVLHFWRGLPYRYQDGYEQAAAEFDQCTDLTEIPAHGRMDIAITYMRLDQCPKALKILNALLDTYSYQDKAAMQRACLELRAESYVAGEQFSEAVVDYKHAARLWPERSCSLLCRAGEILRFHHKNGEALAVLNEVAPTQTMADDGSYFLCRAACLFAQGKWPESVKDSTTAMNRAQACIKRGGEAQQAIFTRALTVRSQCYDHMGKTDLARIDRLTFQKLSKDAESDFLGTSK